MKLNIKSTLFFCLLLISSSPSLGMQQGSSGNSSSWYQGFAIGTAIGCTVTAAISYWWANIDRVKYKEISQTNLQRKSEIENCKQEKEKIKNEANDLKKLNEDTRNKMIAASKKDEDRINGCYRLLEKKYKEIDALKKVNAALVKKQQRNAVLLTSKAAGITMSAENSSHGSSKRTPKRRWKK